MSYKKIRDKYLGGRKKGDYTRDPKVRREVLKRYGGVCYLCGRIYTKNKTLARANPGIYFYNLHIDHIVPFSYFGPNELTNYAVTCRECNLKKGNKI